MKFRVKLKKLELFKRLSHHSRKSSSNDKLSIISNEEKSNNNKNFKQQYNKNQKLLLTRSADNFPKRSIIDSSLKSKVVSLTNQSIFSSKESILNKQTYSQQDNQSAIIEIEHKSYSSLLSSNDSDKPLEKSYSSPLPINKNYLFNNNNKIQSAHMINPYEDNTRRRSSLLKIWRTTVDKLPPILNCIWRQRLHRTGSREFCKAFRDLYI